MSFSFDYVAKNAEVASRKLAEQNAPPSVKTVVEIAIRALGEKHEGAVSVKANGHLSNHHGDYAGGQSVHVEVMPVTIHG